MDAQRVLDCIIFQLTPTRTRCELFVVAGDAMERLASGLLKPFLSHLQTAEEQLAKGGYSIKLEPPDGCQSSWFTKGTAERFVRFVSTPGVIERVNIIETELMQLEETIRMQTLTPTRVEDLSLVDSSLISLQGDEVLSSSEKPRLLKKMNESSIDNNSMDLGAGKNSKSQLLRALDARRLILQKEQGMAFARAAAAGFELVHLLQLIVFSDYFGASRLREACINFVALCKKRRGTGFCTGDVMLEDQDLTWAFSNAACNSILKSMKDDKIEDGVLSKDVKASLYEERRMNNGNIRFDASNLEKDDQQKLPSVHLNTSPASYRWSNTTDSSYGWPAMYPRSNSAWAGYHHGFSSLESFYDVFPSDMRCKSPHAMSLRKLQVGHRAMPHVSRSASQDGKSQESLVHSEATDSSAERSDSLRVTSGYVQEFPSTGDGSMQDAADSKLGMTCNGRSVLNKVAQVDEWRTKRSKKKYDSSDSTGSLTESELPSFRAMSSIDSEIAIRHNKDTASLERPFVLHQCRGTVDDKTLQAPNRDDSLFWQGREGSLGSRFKKRLEFQEPEAHSIQSLQQQLQQELKPIDDSFFVYSPLVTREEKAKVIVESVLQGNQIYDMMSKKALKVNSVMSNQKDPDDLLMMPKQRKRPTGSSNDVMIADVELLKSDGRTKLPNLRKPLGGTEPSQERVRKFLDQYNEKREAKLRGELSGSKRAEREGKLKAMEGVLEKRKLEMGRTKRLERTNLQVDAQIRADKLRMYKAGLQKTKKEEEEKERKRLEGLKAQRQERIAARSNPSSSLTRGRTTSQLPTSKLSPRSRLSQVPKSRPASLNSRVVPSSFQRAASSAQHNSNVNPPKASRSFSKAPINQLRSSAPSASESARQTGRANALPSSSGSRSKKTNTLRAPQRTESPTLKNNSMVSGKRDGYMSRTLSMRKSEPSSITGKKQGLLPDSCSTSNINAKKVLPLERSINGVHLNSGKEMPRSSEEIKKQEGKTFLKKGSGAGSLGRSVQRPKATSPGKAKAGDKRPLFLSGSHVNGLKNVRLNTKEISSVKISERDAGITANLPTVVESKNSLGEMNMSRSDALVNTEQKPLIPRWSYDEEMAIPSNSIQQSASSVVAELASHGTMPNLNSCNAQIIDSAMSRLSLFDRSCTIDPRDSKKQSVIFNMESPSRGSTVTESSGSLLISHSIDKASSSPLLSELQTPLKEQPKSFKSFLKFGRRTLWSPGSEGYGVGDTVKGAGDGEHYRSEGIGNCGRTPDDDKKQKSASSSSLNGLKSGPALRPFSFLGTLRSKAAEAKWH